LIGQLDIQVQPDKCVDVVRVNPSGHHDIAIVLLAAALFTAFSGALIAFATNNGTWFVAGLAISVGAALLAAHFWTHEQGSPGAPVLSIDPVRDLIVIHDKDVRWLSSRFEQIKPSELRELRVIRTQRIYDPEPRDPEEPDIGQLFAGAVTQHDEMESLWIVVAGEEPECLVEKNREGRASDIALALQAATGLVIDRQEALPDTTVLPFIPWHEV